jgi:hypothetical protein
LPSGDWLPPLNTIRDRVIFYYTNVDSGAQYWDREGKYWAKNAERFMAPSGVIKKAAADLVAPGDNDQARARKIYAAVMKIDNRDFAHSDGEGSKSKGSKDASAVWKQQSGTSDEIALLFVALARATGLSAWPMQLVNRNRAQFERTYLSTDQFDDYIAVVETDGKDVYLDPGQKMCAYGALNWKHEMATGFRLTAKGVTIEATPAGPPKAAGIKRTADVAIDDHGAVTGTGRFVLSGQEALYWRQLALLEDSSELSKDLADYVASTLPDGVSGTINGFEGLTDYESDLTANLKFSGVLGSSTEKRVIVPGLFFEARGKHPFVEEESREVPVDMHYATMEQDDVTYHLPPGVKLDNLPQERNIEWTGRIGLSINVTSASNAVTVKRAFVRTSALIDPSLYSSLRNIYQRISAADQQQIVLSRAADTGAN